MQRKSGVLMHISSLWGDYRIGSFGKSAKEFVDFLYNCKFSYWQVLPFGMTDEFNSPYKSNSSFAGNPYFIDLDILKDKELISESELASEKQEQPYKAEFEKLSVSRLNLLKTASKRVKNTAEINDFIENKPYLKEFCEFMAYKEENSQKAWYEWDIKEKKQETLFMWKFIQYEFFMQWAQIKNYANSKGIKIIGDMPFYVSLDSSDVWANKEQFQLDKRNLPTHISGVPPDYFSQDGQLWGNPLYNWGKMQKNGYKWWTDRIKYAIILFDGVRLDHFRGFESYWSVHQEEKTAKNGTWQKGPGTEFISLIKENAKEKLIIAEDLGEITPEVESLVQYSGFPSMRVLQFGFSGDYDNPHMPHNYTNNCVAYSGTHDNNTLLGYLSELDDFNKKRLLDYCGCLSAEKENCLDGIIRSMLASAAGLVIFPVQDLLGFGTDTRLNTPGTVDANWQFRVTKEQLDSIDQNKIRHLNELYKRI